MNTCRCSKCGKFIGYKEFNEGNVVQEYDVQEQLECTGFHHKRCKITAKITD